MNKKHRYQELVELIISDYCRRLAPGELLPGLPELCRKYRTSEITIKKAMSLLAENGLVKRIPGKGTEVLDSPVLRSSAPFCVPRYKLRLLTLENWSFSDYLEEQAARYSRLNPEVVFSVSRKAVEGEQYDLIAMNERGWVNVDTEALCPLENLHGLNLNPDSFVPDVLKFCRRDGQLYMLPLGFSPLVCIFNLDRPEIRQIDWRNLQTFEQFTEAMLTVKSEELRYPFFCMSMDPGTWGHFIHSHGGRIEDIGSPEARAGLQVMYDMLHKHHICPVVNDYTFHWNLFNTGRFIATWGKYGRIRNNPGMRLGIAPLPHANEKNGSLFLEGVAVSKTSRNIPQVKDFLNFLLGMEPQLDLCKKTDGLCTQKIVAEYHLEKSHRHIDGYRNLISELEYMRLVPDSPAVGRLIRNITVPLQLLTLGVYSPAEFCAEVIGNNT